MRASIATPRQIVVLFNILTLAGCTHTAELPRRSVLLDPEESDEPVESLVGFTTDDGVYHRWREVTAADRRPDATEIGIVHLQLPDLASPRGQAILGFTTTSGEQHDLEARAFLVPPDSLRISGEGGLYETFDVRRLESLSVRRARVGVTVMLVVAVGVVVSAIVFFSDPFGDGFEPRASSPR